MSIKITDNSGEVLQGMNDAVIRALEICGLTAEGYAKDLCPVNTGELRNSISHAVDEAEPAAYIGTNLYYAPYVELGTGIYVEGGRDTPWAWQDEKGKWHMTHGQRAQPFIKPAAEDHGDQYRDIFEQALRGD